MTRDEAAAIVALPKEQAIDAIVALAEKAEKYDQLRQDVSPTCPSGMTPPYLKPACGKRRKKPGRKRDTPGRPDANPKRLIIAKSIRWKAVQTVTVHCKSRRETINAIRKTYRL
jgi:hypothetical protein